ncbi:hypothetical protein ABBQ38_012793 [Trebouxia sp. C0009 RCD-2024]
MPAKQDLLKLMHYGCPKQQMDTAVPATSGFGLFVRGSVSSLSLYSCFASLG